jgi:hypothetical protein
MKNYSIDNILYIFKFFIVSAKISKAILLNQLHFSFTVNNTFNQTFENNIFEKSKD